MRSSIALFGVVGMVAMVACSSESEPDAGVISLAVASAPTGTACLRVTVEGASGTVQRTLPLSPGNPTTGTLSGLPLGAVSVEAEAFNYACSALTANSVASWVSNPTSAVLTPGTPVAVQLVMQKAGQISVSVDWNTGGSGSGGSGGSSGGGSGGSAGGGSGGLLSVAAPINGQMLVGKCLVDSAASVCQTAISGCPAANPNDPSLSGALLTDKSFTLGGTPGTSYTVTVHVQGEVEAKFYTNSVDQNNVATSPKADGFATNGSPTQGNAYSIYLLRVTNPGGTKTDYFLNSLVGPGVSDHTTYGVDYVAKIKAEGGATIRLVAADPNCSMIKNCGPTPNSGAQCAAPVLPTNIEPTVVSANPTFDFTKPFNGQWLSLAVTNVTTP